MKKQQTPTGFNNLIVTVVAVALLVGVGVFRVWTRTECVRLGYALSAAQEEAERMSTDRARLQAEVAALESPVRIRKIARTRLGLQPSVPEQVIAIRHRPSSLGQRIARNDLPNP